VLHRTGVLQRPGKRAMAIPRMGFGAPLQERDSVLCLMILWILRTALWRVPPLEGVPLPVVCIAPKAIVIARPVGQAFQN
jgi:hypothetical protein